MFTRYQGINLPKNYGGSLFYDGQIEEDTKTKLHKPNIYGASKSTVSPSFGEIYNDGVPDKVQYQSDEFKALKNDTFTNKNEILPTPVDEFYSNEYETDTQYSENSDNAVYDEYSSNENPMYRIGYGNSYEQNSYNGVDFYDDNELNVQCENKCESEQKSEEYENKNREKKGTHLFKIGDLLSKADSDEILILSIILLISCEGNHENDDILPILALLLLSRKR